MCLLAYDKEGNIIHIDDALPRTDYICSDCGNILRVKKGEIKAKHFFHLNTENCGGTGESLIHKYFKKKILKFKTIKIPIYYLEENTNKIKCSGLERFKIKTAHEEVRLLDGKLIPDILLELENGFKIAVEICYKNPKGEEEIEKYKKIGLAALELKIDENMKIYKSKLLYSKKIEALKKRQILEYNSRPMQFINYIGLNYTYMKDVLDGSFVLSGSENFHIFSEFEIIVIDPKDNLRRYCTVNEWFSSEKESYTVITNYINKLYFGKSDKRIKLLNFLSICVKM